MTSGYFYVDADGRLLPLEEAPSAALRAYAAMQDHADAVASVMAHVAETELKRRADEAEETKHQGS